jgi:hypothetical protein
MLRTEAPHAPHLTDFLLVALAAVVERALEAVRCCVLKALLKAMPRSTCEAKTSSVNVTAQLIAAGARHGRATADRLSRQDLSTGPGQENILKEHIHTTGRHT